MNEIETERVSVETYASYIMDTFDETDENQRLLIEAYLKDIQDGRITLCEEAL